MTLHALAGGRQANPVVLTGKKRQPQMFFQLTNTGTHSGCRHTQIFRRPAEIARTTHFQEGFQQQGIHGGHSFGGIGYIFDFIVRNFQYFSFFRTAKTIYPAGSRPLKEQS
jgi:hypothetical protein